MIEKIKSVIAGEQPIKARDIARRLGVDVSRVNGTLYAHVDVFVRNQKFEWSLIGPRVLEIEFPTARWLAVSRFEATLSSVDSPLESDYPAVLFRFAPETPILLEVVARLLSLCNQLIEAKKDVTIEFQDPGVSNYLNRLGFYDLLHESVKILPERPQISTAGVYEGESTSIVEAKRIDLACRDENIPLRLSQCVRQHVQDAGTSIHTIVSELFSNIYEHSSSPIPGFAALQLYRGRNPHVSTVFSDSGTGIIGSLLPSLPKTTAEKLGEDGKNVGVALIEKIFAEGGLSRTREQGHGTGLYSAGASAKRFRNGTVIVRQETLEVTIKFQNGDPVFSSKLGLRKLVGTQICVKFALTRLDDAR